MNIWVLLFLNCKNHVSMIAVPPRRNCWNLLEKLFSIAVCNANLFSKVAVPKLCPYSRHEFLLPFTPLPPLGVISLNSTHLRYFCNQAGYLSFCVFLFLYILVGREWYLTVILICISLILNGAGAPSVNCLFKTLTIFLLEYFASALQKFFLYFGYDPNTTYMCCKDPFLTYMVAFDGMFLI